MPKNFAITHIDEDCTELTGPHSNELFFNCEFKKLGGLSLEHCVLNQSRFTTDKIEDAMGFSLTLDCGSFSNVEYSELLFDLLLVLMIKTKGNIEKRRKLIEIVGRERVIELGHTLEAKEW